MPVTTLDSDDQAADLPYAEPDAPIHVRLSRRRTKRRAQLAAMPPKSSFRSTAEWVAVIVGALAVAFLIRTFLFGAYVIPSGSMEPTLEFQPTKDRVLVNKLAYQFHDINRGDVIVFDNPDPNPADGTDVLIKRVIALAGETIEMDPTTGQVTINGQLLQEPYVNPACVTPGDPLTTQLIPEGHVFVMGDNRCDSSDGRRFGPIDTDSVIGRAFVRVWPLGRFGWL